MTQTPAKNFPVAKALGVLIGAMGLEYGLCYLAALVVSDTLLHGRLDQPVAALGFWAMGSLASHFVKPRQPKPQPQLTLAMPQLTLAMPPMPPGLMDDLAALLDKNDHDAAADAAAKPTPYL